MKDVILSTLLDKICDMKEKYYNLFSPICSIKYLDNIMMGLPFTLVEIIFCYCELDCLNDQDKNLIYSRLSKLEIC